MAVYAQNKPVSEDIIPGTTITGKVMDASTDEPLSGVLIVETVENDTAAYRYTFTDKDGCFSGSAIELDDGRLALVYTGVTKRRNESGIEKEFQTQCVAFGDGVNFEKYQYNPVIAGDVLPEGSSINDFRDPKVWKENGIFNMYDDIDAALDAIKDKTSG